MEKIIKKRAISDKAKAERKQAIIETAKKKYVEEKNISIPVSEIAKNAGLAKGTIYLYFKTREAMDLEILRQCIGNCFDKIDSVLNNEISPGRLMEVMSGFASDFLLVRLGSRYNLIMEKCGDYEVVVEFKEYLNTRIEKTASDIMGLFPFIEKRELIELFIGSFSLMIGLCQMAEPAFIARDVLETRGLVNLQLDFETVFPKLLGNLWSDFFSGGNKI
ncbi:MAG: TetR family transcriptional regulator [Desulfobacteraceae bacterium]|nr:TetR family transcriptional regulator [Desulfobacteraceae bacterium]MCB9494702.1 TetR family transcriptional regulator [Desulfobacteraceae bacterium]